MICDVNSALIYSRGEKKTRKLLVQRIHHINYFVTDEKSWPTFSRATDKCDFKTIKTWFESLV